MGDVVMIDWPAFGRPVLRFAREGTLFACLEFEGADLCAPARSALFAEAIEWGRDVSAPLPEGWRRAS